MELKALKDKFFVSKQPELPNVELSDDDGRPESNLPETEFNFKIRPADIHDVTAIALLWSKMVSEVFDKYIEQDKVELDKFAFAMADRLRTSHAFTQVALEANRIVGFIHGYVQERPYGRPTRIAFCECLYVEPEYRGKNINKKLIDNFINWAEKNDLIIEFLTKFDQDLVKLWGREKFQPYCIVFRR